MRFLIMFIILVFPVVANAEVYVWAENEGFYTVQFLSKNKDLNVDVYINGKLVGSNVDSPFELGRLTTSDTIHITVDGLEADKVKQCNNSWSLFYADFTTINIRCDGPLAKKSGLADDVLVTNVEDLDTTDTTVSVTFGLPTGNMKKARPVKAFLGLYFNDGTVTMLAGEVPQ